MKPMGGMRALKISAKTVTVLIDGLACEVVATSPNGFEITVRVDGLDAQMEISLPAPLPLSYWTN